MKSKSIRHHFMSKLHKKKEHTQQEEDKKACRLNISKQSKAKAEKG